MKVILDLEQGVWTSLLMRAHEENISASEVVNAWIRRAVRQDRTVLPTTEARAKVVNISRQTDPGGTTS